MKAMSVVRSIRTHRELFVNLMMRELRTRYRMSVLGWLWSMVNPALLTLVYSFVFTKFLVVVPDPGEPSGNDVFALYLLSGLLPWNLFTGGLSVGMNSLIGAGGLIQKVRFPRELVVLGPVAALGVSLLIELSVLVLATSLFGFLMLHLVPVVIYISLLLLLFTMGVAMALAAWNIRYRDVQHITNVALLILFYLTPILYSPKVIPTSVGVLGIDVPVRTILLNNPLSRYVQLYRNCFYDVRFPPLDTLIGATVLSVVVFLLGAHVFVTRSPRFPEEI